MSKLIWCDNNDPRWHLDDADVHCGDGLELAMDDGTWLPVRFEVRYPATAGIDPRDLMPTPKQFPVIHLSVRDCDPWLEVTDGMSFRWPAREWACRAQEQRQS